MPGTRLNPTSLIAVGCIPLTLLLSNCGTEAPSSSTSASQIAVAISPGSASLLPGGAQDFVATVANDPGTPWVTWWLSGPGCSGAACGTLSESNSASGEVVTYTAPTTRPTPAAVTVTAISATDKTRSGTAAITITPPPPLPIVLDFVVPGGNTTVAVNGQLQFTVTVANDPNRAGVAWTVTGPGCSGAACGSLSATHSDSGALITYTAPATVPYPGVVDLTAISVTDPTRSIVLRVWITSLVTVSITPAVSGVDLNTTQQLTATLTNDATNAGVTWTVSGLGCSGAACGTLSTTSSASGVAITYTAPATVPNPAAVVTVTATSVADFSKVASATVVTTTPGVLSVGIVVARPSICTGQPARWCLGGMTRPFTAYVFNDPSNAGVTWSTGIGSVSPTTSASGVPVTYTAPSHSCGSSSVTATSVADGTRSATAAVTLHYPGQPPGC